MAGPREDLRLSTARTLDPLAEAVRVGGEKAAHKSSFQTLNSLLMGS